MEDYIILEFIDYTTDHWEYFIKFEEGEKYNWNITCKFPNNRKHLIKVDLRDEKNLEKCMEEIFNDNSRYYEIDWLNGVEIVKKLLKKRSERAITFEELKKEMKILEEIINKHNENEVEDL
ncbi:hypothetical protein [Fusobacterium varium]|uniref:hypothetical protein n=1 Tax=Fusobacterium varium TaxID=856 RepID=UPI000E3FAE01|nr:hypothetical protein [Fusobacterium varium]MCI6033309.1 hypothetical protein [Fusobacterium varium]RGJ28610.1 hypothetical protein DXD66_07635 [Fusobacterium varium]